MEEMKLIFQELYMSLSYIKAIDERNEQYYSLITDRAMKNLKKINCSKQQKQRMLGEIILLSQEVIVECSSIF